MRDAFRILLITVSLAFAVPGAALAALDPSEVLEDPELESRARGVSAGLRCMVCQNQSIDDSDAELARDLRLLVRERIAAGETDEEVVEYVVSRYGEFVLMRPQFSARNALLWVSPLVLLLVGGGFMLARARRMRAAGPARATTGGLSPEESRRLKEILDRQ